MGHCLPRLRFVSRTSGVAGALLVASMVPASATFVCAVQKSRDGFAALRKEPHAQSGLIAKAREGEAVVILQHANGDQIARGPWLRVLHFPDTTVPAKSDPAYKKGRTGWMHKTLVGDCG